MDVQGKEDVYQVNVFAMKILKEKIVLNLFVIATIEGNVYITGNACVIIPSMENIVKRQCARTIAI
jgi:hypothetical protein